VGDLSRPLRVGRPEDQQDDGDQYGHGEAHDEPERLVNTYLSLILTNTAFNLQDPDRERQPRVCMFVLPVAADQ